MIAYIPELQRALCLVRNLLLPTEKVGIRSKKSPGVGYSVDQTQQVSWYVALSKPFRAKNKGQALVEFSLCFILLLVIAWIPADFGLAFYTGQLASNAAREGARIGSAATPFNVNDVVAETCRRLPSALLSDPGAALGTSCAAFSNSNARVQVIAPPGTASCNDAVTVTVSGNYNFFFYRILYLMGITSDLNTQSITRQTSMRWEHQC